MRSSPRRAWSERLPDVLEAAKQALDLLREIERDAAERFPVAGTSAWYLVRESLFELPGGLLDAVSGRRVETSRAVAAAGRRLPGLSTLIAAERRRRLPALGARGRPLVVVAQGKSVDTEDQLPGDRWSAPYRPELEGANWLSLFPPPGGPGRDADRVRRGVYLPWEAGLTRADAVRLLADRSRLRRRLADLWRSPSTSAAVRDLVRPEFRPPLEAVFVRLARNLSLANALLVAAGRIVERLEPSAIVSFDAMGNAGRAFAHAGAGRVPTIGVQAGLISPLGLPNLGYLRRTQAAAAPRPDLVVVWGTFYADVLHRLGWPPDAPRVGGFPTHDGGEGATGAGVLLYLASAAHGPNGAFAAPEDEVRLVAELAVAVRGGGLRLRVRPHPGDPPDHTARLAEHADEVDSAARLDDSLRDAAAVLGGGTTALVHALRAGLPSGVAAVSGVDVPGFGALGLPVFAPGGDHAAQLHRLLAPDAGDRSRRVAGEVAAPKADVLADVIAHREPGPGAGVLL